MSEAKLVRGLDDIAPNNSDKAVRSKTIEPNTTKNGQPKMKPIVKGPVVKQKSSFATKFKESFFGENDNIGDFVLYDVLVPAFKNTLSDMGFGIVEMLFGRGSSRNGGCNNRILRDGGRSYISYNDISRGRDDRREINYGDRARHNFENVVYTSRGEAEDVLSHLVDLIAEYNEATVGAFYELSGIDSSPADYNYGWTNLRDAYTDRARNGYIIRFPQVRPL